MIPKPRTPEPRKDFKPGVPALCCVLLLGILCFAPPFPGNLLAGTKTDSKKPTVVKKTDPVPNHMVSPDIKIFREFEDKSLTPFHVPDALKANVEFWKDVYSRYSTTEMVVHDSRHLDIIFEVIKVYDKPDITGAYLLDKAVERKMNPIKEHYQELLKLIQNKINSGKSLTPDQQKIANRYNRVKGDNKFLAAADRVRAQPGMRERFLGGIIRSGLYLDKMKKIFLENGLPIELTVLPHVESSFSPTVLSSAGAAGMWQFMRSTGSMYMKTNYTLDERLDPITSTRAAAKLLKRNFEELGNWPMAIIAYNYGLGGMKRAKRRMGEEVTHLINGYKSPLFGFASRNFYSEFLAALAIMNNISKFFGQVTIDPPLELNTLILDSFINIDDLSRYLLIDKEVIRKYNPALRTPVLESEKLVPKGYALKLPPNRGGVYKERLALIPQKLLSSKQIRSAWYRVMPGDNLSRISRRFETTIASLVEINNVRKAGMIYAGQILKIPRKNKTVKGVNEDW